VIGGGESGRGLSFCYSSLSRLALKDPRVLPVMNKMKEEGGEEGGWLVVVGRKTRKIGGR
jgi:hypothetical protein